MILRARTALIPTVLALVASAAAQSSEKASYYDELIRSMGIEQKLGAKAALDARFTDENGKSVTIGELTKGKPLLLLPTYYTGPTTCPMLTDDVLQTLARTTKEGSLTLGKDLEVAMIGINPNEGPKDASAKKIAAVNAVFEDEVAQKRRNPLNALKGSGQKSPLPELMKSHFTILTGSLDQIKKLTDSVGFRYRYDAKTKAVDYPTGTILLTPDGTISAYTIGNDLPTRVLEGEVALAAKGELSPKADQVQMFGCLSYNPAKGPYRDIVQNAIRVTGTLTVLILGFSIFSMSRKQKGSSSDPGGAPKA